MTTKRFQKMAAQEIVVQGISSGADAPMLRILWQGIPVSDILMGDDGGPRALVHLRPRRGFDIFPELLTEIRRLCAGLSTFQASPWKEGMRRMLSPKPSFRRLAEVLAEGEGIMRAAFHSVRYWEYRANGRAFPLEIFSDHGGWRGTVAEVVSRLRIQEGIAIDAVEVGEGWRGEKRIRFRVSGGPAFVFWRQEDPWTAGSVPLSQWRRHVIPADHPCRRGDVCGTLVNGDTDALITGSDVGITALDPPEASLRPAAGSAYGRWNRIASPFMANGEAVCVAVDPLRFQTRRAADRLTRVLREALGRVPGVYAGVSGGFRAPYERPGTALAAFRSSGRPGCRKIRQSDIRGSEAECVWAYRHLQAAGGLSGAYIPAGFDEAWLDVYAEEIRRVEKERG